MQRSFNGGLIMKININDTVRVKLTDTGRAMLVEQDMRAYKLPEADGYTEFHLWELMQVFGSAMFHGNPNLPFETNMELKQ